MAGAGAVGGFFKFIKTNRLELITAEVNITFLHATRWIKARNFESVSSAGSVDADKLLGQMISPHWSRTGRDIIINMLHRKCQSFWFVSVFAFIAAADIIHLFYAMFCFPLFCTGITPSDSWFHELCTSPCADVSLILFVLGSFSHDAVRLVLQHVAQCVSAHLEHETVNTF